jgi:peptidoglycan hydrolase CwlO-like protein
MSFDMQKLGQFGLWVKAVSEQVSKNTDDIEELKEEIKQLKLQLNSKQKHFDPIYLDPL